MTMIVAWRQFPLTCHLSETHLTLEKKATFIKTITLKVEIFTVLKLASFRNFNCFCKY